MHRALQAPRDRTSQTLGPIKASLNASGRLKNFKLLRSISRKFDANRSTKQPVKYTTHSARSWETFAFDVSDFGSSSTRSPLSIKSAKDPMQPLLARSPQRMTLAQKILSETATLFPDQASIRREAPIQDGKEYDKPRRIRQRKRATGRRRQRAGTDSVDQQARTATLGGNRMVAQSISLPLLEKNLGLMGW